MSGKRKRGRPKGTLRGRKEDITIRVSKEHKFYLWAQRQSYSKTLENLMKDAIEGK